jgi:hypothetical protein
LERKSVLLQNIEREGGRDMERVRPSELIVHHSSNPERSIPAESRVHQVPPDNTLMVAAGDFVSPAPVPELVLGLGIVPLLDPEALLVAVTCPEISGKKKRVCDEPLFTTLYGRD